MNTIAVILLGIALSLDSLAVSLGVGMACKTIRGNRVARFIAVITLFHIGMTFIGWGAGGFIGPLLGMYDHWIAFALLAGLGIKMIIDANKSEKEQQGDEFLCLCNTLLLGVALSIDALISGFSLGLVTLEIIPNTTQLLNIIIASIIVGLCAGVISWVGFLVGVKGARRFIPTKPEIAGGTILILIGVEILLEHLL